MNLPPLHELCLKACPTRTPVPPGAALPENLDCPICLKSLREPAPGSEYPVDPLWERICSQHHVAHVWCAHKLASRAPWWADENQPCPVCRTPMLDGLEHKPQSKFQPWPTNGHHKHTFLNGDVYEGEWENRLPNGQGEYTYTNGLKKGQVYKGEWKNGEKSGYGKYTWPNGDVYEGEWEAGLQKGRGKMTLSNGTVYEGEWSGLSLKVNGTFKSVHELAAEELRREIEGVGASAIACLAGE